ncbi:MAG: ThuA domain-containing protein [Thermoguttaceae bacterium]
MFRPLVLFLFLALFLSALLLLQPMARAQLVSKRPADIRVLFVYGGHGFDEKEMYTLLNQLEGVKYDRVQMPAALAMLRPGLEKQYDCIVLYDHFTFPFTKEQTDHFVDLLKTGIGLVVLHHAICDYPGWDGFPQMIGGRYVLTKDGETIDSTPRSPSTYKHDVTVRVKVVDKAHPILQGVDDFEIFDEVYGNVYVNPDVHVLLTTDHPDATRQLAWTWRFGKTPVFVLLLGHDKKSYRNAQFRQILKQGIHWTCR